MDIKAKNSQGTWDVYCPHGVGDILETKNDVSPATRWPGTVWAAMGAGKVLVGIDPNDADFDTIGKMGGSKTHIHGLGDGYAKISLFTGFKDIATVQKAVPGYIRTHNNTFTANSWYSDLSQGTATALGGTTDTGSTVQPYEVVFRWERTA